MTVKTKALPTVAVLDIGKTNKKVSVYDRSFRVLDEERISIKTTTWRGIEVEDTPALLAWFRGALKRLAARHTIHAIAVSAHGATFALLDETGKLALPIISYTTPQGESIQEEFYQAFGAKTDLHRSTGTADLGFANMAKVLYYIKTRFADVWPDVRHGLFYGPYIGYELTGRRGLENTFPGNHTYFWDFESNEWSEVARKLGAHTLFGDFPSRSWDCLGTVSSAWAADTALLPDCKVTYGIHDSNANFLPYAAKGHENFVLNSTGSWCVLMGRATSASLTDEEIQAKVFFNRDPCGKPVRTAVFTAGLDYDAFSAFSDCADEQDDSALAQVLAGRDLFIVPGVLAGASAFPGEQARVIYRGDAWLTDDLQRGGGTPMTGHGQQYFAALNLSLALATAKMLGACRVGAGTTVFIEGGFAKNRLYGQLLAALCPQQRFVTTNLKEGTSFGAAITAWMCATGETLETIGQSFDVETKPIAPAAFDGLEAYRDAFYENLRCT